jgi:hypothetical protein
LPRPVPPPVTSMRRPARSLALNMGGARFRRDEFLLVD